MSIITACFCEFDISPESKEYFKKSVMSSPTDNSKKGFVKLGTYTITTRGLSIFQIKYPMLLDLPSL